MRLELNNTKTDTDNLLMTSNQLKSYTIKISGNLHERISKYLRLMKHLDEGCNTKQDWIITAIKEKIESEKGNEVSQQKMDEKHIHFKLDSELCTEISQITDKIKEYRSSFTKTQLFLEAISEKIERDEKKAKKLIDAVKSFDDK